MDIIMKRKSTRKYTDEKISDETMQQILKAAQSGPSTANTRPWHFIVVKDKETLNKMSNANGPYSKMLNSADAAILICGDLEKTIPSAKEFWVIDGAIAIQNMCIAATSLGVGNVWLGTWPIEERVNNLRELFDLPDHIIPHSVLSLGIPEDLEKFNEINQRAIFEEEKVHYEKW